MAKVIDIERQQITVDALQRFVLDLVARVDYVCPPGSGRTVTVVSRDEQRVVAAFTTANAYAQINMVKEVTAVAPDHVVYRHVAGPYVGAVEDLYLLARHESTDVLLDARLPLAESSSALLHRTAFEREAQQHLRDIKAVAESRGSSAAETPAPTTMLADLPDDLDERQLLKAVDAQEAAEWGHVGHGRGVARVAISLAESIMLPKRQIEALVRASLLHDVGKLAVPSELWGKLGILSNVERESMYAHAGLGADLAARAGLPDPIQASIRHHHERWDGRGYPGHLAGEAIPLRARIIAIGECVDTMMRATYRRETLGTARVLDALDRGAGSIWDPMLAREAHRIIKGK